MKSAMSWREYQRLELIPRKTPNHLPREADKPTLRSRLNNIWQTLLAYLEPSSEPHVWQTRTSSGELSWNAFDPVTGRSIHGVSDAEMRIWLEKRYYPTDLKHSV